MIYETPDSSESLSQGDIFDDCPILFWDCTTADAMPQSDSTSVRVVVLTQACDLIHQGKRVVRIRTPYREHLAQHFSTTYARIGLPEPYPTQPET